MTASEAEARLRRERDFYRRLLALGTQEQIEPFLAEALALVVEIAGASRGYLEVRDERAGADACWWLAHGCAAEDVEALRAAISRGIVAEALATGRTVVTLSAFLDPRFEARQSVQTSRIQAVLCAPVGEGTPVGVVYLEADAPGPWPTEVREHTELFARHIAPIADRLLARRRERGDATQKVRAKLRLEGVVGSSAALARTLEQVALVAPLDVTVLLTGESGTGKSQLARAIHDNGPRAGGPFVELNCAALPEGLIESELFGAAAGAHSTAARPVPGKVGAAEGGTLFLDEVGELVPAAQAKLLHLLHAREYFPLGGARAVRADVRLIAATNVDLEHAVAEKRFREDLYYRLRVLPIRVPSLAERSEDLVELSGHLLGLACRRHGLPALALSPGALRAVEAAPWPGNVRELAHALEAAAIRASGEGALSVEVHHVFPGERSAPERETASFQEATRRFQLELLRRTLRETDWNVTEAARRLDLARSHVYNLIRAFGLERDEAGSP